MSTSLFSVPGLLKELTAFAAHSSVTFSIIVCLRLVRASCCSWGRFVLCSLTVTADIVACPIERGTSILLLLRPHCYWMCYWSLRHFAGRCTQRLSGMLLIVCPCIRCCIVDSTSFGTGQQHSSFWSYMHLGSLTQFSTVFQSTICSSHWHCELVF